MGKTDKGRASQDEPRNTPALALLRRLAQPGCFAKVDVIDERRLSLFRRQERATLGQGHVAREAAERLLAEGLARWQGQGARELHITPAGAARVKRLSGEENPFGAQHRAMETQDHAGEALRINAAESPLLWLHRRKGRDGQPLIDAASFAAGERLRADLTMAGTLPRVTANWEASVAQSARGGQSGLNASEAAVAAQQRVHRAMQAVGPEVSGLLIDVCGFLKGLEQIERERQWPARSGKLILGMALSRLAAHYGLSNEAQGRASRRPRLWRAEGARPPSPFEGSL